MRNRAVMARTIGRLSPERAVAFLERLRALRDEFDALSESDPDGDPGADAQPYALTVAFYPSRPQAAEEDPA